MIYFPVLRKIYKKFAAKQFLFLNILKQQPIQLFFQFF